jgi:hypothetical protein
MTYGGFLVFEGEDKDPGIPYPQSTEYPDFIHRYKKYRLDLWRPSHMRTYRGFLIKSVNRNDLKDLIENKDYWHASDLAFQYPCLEMCSKDRIKVIDFYAHVYNQSKTNKDRTKERESVDNSKYEIEIRKRKQYKYIVGCLIRHQTLQMLHLHFIRNTLNLIRHEHDTNIKSEHER